MWHSTKRSFLALSRFAARRMDDSSFSLSSLLRASGVVLICGLAAGCSTVGDPDGATASVTRPAEAPSVEVAHTASPVVSTATSASNGTDKPYVLAGKTYTPRAPAAPGKVGVGLASWYGPDFHGRRTANGETFDMASFTAAHPTLPLPSYVRVTNVQNGRSIVVRVNDRGPFHKGRLIDVSQRTADTLGFRGAGVGNVKVDYIGPAPAVRDDRKMLATYQEFGRPAMPAGVQMASLTPVSDAALMAESGRPVGVVGTLVATATNAATMARDSVVSVATSIPLPGVSSTPKPSPVVVASSATVKPAPLKAGSQPEPELASVGLSKPVHLPARQPVGADTAVALAKPALPPASGKVEMITVASAETRSEPAHKRVVQPAAPVLASSTPELPKSQPASQAASEPKVNVAARIASSFDAFGSSAFGQSYAPAAPGLAYNSTR